MGGHSNNGREKQKRFPIFFIATILIVAMVPVAVVSDAAEARETKAEATETKGAEESGMTTLSTETSGESICQSTEYKEMCEKSLGSSLLKVTDPKKLLKAGFNASVMELLGKVNNSTLYKEMAVDDMTKQAMDVCTEVLDYAVDCILKSSEVLDNVEFNKLIEHVFDLKVWLTGSTAHQYTCLLGFENIKKNENISNAMGQILRASLELTDNALDMINVIHKLLNKKLQGNKIANRRLLNLEASLPDGFHSWVGEEERRFLQVSSQNADAVVAQDGSGNFKTVAEALKTVPANNEKPFVIHVKAGTYKEKVDVTKAMRHVTIVGDGPTQTKFTGSLNYVDGVNTFNSATFAVHGHFFVGKNIGIENTAGAEKQQAVALMVTADKAVFQNVHVDGFQDSLFAQSQRQFYRDCTITGTIDFVFGDAFGVFQNCKLIVKTPLSGTKNIVTADGRSKEDSDSAFVFIGCQFTGVPEMLSANPKLAFLGRPWKPYAKVVIMDSQIDDAFDPEGFQAFLGEKNKDTCTYYEFNNKGPGANRSKRVKWKNVMAISSSEAAKYYPDKFFKTANSADGDSWIRDTGVPYSLGASSS